MYKKIDHYNLVIRFLGITHTLEPLPSAFPCSCWCRGCGCCH